jgi:hypothetical protein
MNTRRPSPAVGPRAGPIDYGLLAALLSIAVIRLTAGL